MSHRSEPTTRVHFPPAVAAGVPVSVAAGVMRRRGLDSLVVLDHGEVCGVLTERDLLRAAATERRGTPEASVADVCSRRLADVMEPDPVLVAAESTVAEAARTMLDAGVGSAVAVDDDGVKGMLSGRDIAAAGERVDPHDLTVAEVCIGVDAVSIDDDLARAVFLARATEGQPVPVIDDNRPVGTVHIRPAPPTALPGAERESAVPSPAPAAVRRPRGGSRFYGRRDHEEGETA